jgi:hypothetical protein
VLGVKASFGIDLESNSLSNPYYDCAGCRNEYEDISGVSINNITHDIRIKKNVES